MVADVLVTRESIRFVISFPSAFATLLLPLALTAPRIKSKLGAKDFRVDT